MSSPYRDENGLVGSLPPDTAAMRVMLRPLGSPLPLGAFALVPAGMVLSGLQLGWFSQGEGQTVALLVLAFAVPLQGLASVLAFLSRDALVGTGFGVFAGVWLAFGVSELTAATGVERAAGVVGLAFVATAGYVGVATLLEDSMHRSVLPIGRRGLARAAFEEGLHAQMGELQQEAGVRNQL